MASILRRRIVLGALGAPVLALSGCLDDDTTPALATPRRSSASSRVPSVGALASVRVPGSERARLRGRRERPSVRLRRPQLDPQRDQVVHGDGHPPARARARHHARGRARQVHSRHSERSADHACRPRGHDERHRGLLDREFGTSCAATSAALHRAGARGPRRLAAVHARGTAYEYSNTNTGSSAWRRGAHHAQALALSHTAYPYLTVRCRPRIPRPTK